MDRLLLTVEHYLRRLDRNDWCKAGAKDGSYVISQQAFRCRPANETRPADEYLSVYNAHQGFDADAFVKHFTFPSGDAPGIASAHGRALEDRGFKPSHQPQDDDSPWKDHHYGLNCPSGGRAQKDLAMDFSVVFPFRIAGPKERLEATGPDSPVGFMETDQRVEMESGPSD